MTGTPVNDAPVCDNVSITTTEDAPGSTLPDCTDVEGDPLTYAANPAGTGVSGFTDPNLTYDPNGQFEALDTGGSDTDSFTYTANDGDLDSAEATVSVTINGVNDAPVCDNVSITTTEDAPGSTLPDCTDVEGDPLTYAANPAGTGVSGFADPNLTYDPNGQFEALDTGGSDTDSFTYTANDGDLDSAEATVSVTINGVNDAPVCDNVSITTTEDAPGSTLPDCTDVEGDPLTYAADPAGTGVSGFADPDLTYDPNGQFEALDTGESDTDSFTYIANDGDLDSAEATVSVTINGVNDAPVCDNVSITTTEDAPGSTLPDCTDVEGDPLTYAANPAGTGVSGFADPNLTYDPNGQFEALDTGESDTDSFTYTANDGDLDSAEATVSVTINGVNDAPANVSARHEQLVHQRERSRRRTRYIQRPRTQSDSHVPLHVEGREHDLCHVGSGGKGLWREPSIP